MEEIQTYMNYVVGTITLYEVKTLMKDYEDDMYMLERIIRKIVMYYYDKNLSPFLKMVREYVEDKYPLPNLFSGVENALEKREKEMEQLWRMYYMHPEMYLVEEVEHPIRKVVRNMMRMNSLSPVYGTKVDLYKIGEDIERRISNVDVKDLIKSYITKRDMLERDLEKDIEYEWVNKVIKTIQYHFMSMYMSEYIGILERYKYVFKDVRTKEELMEVYVYSDVRFRNRILKKMKQVWTEVRSVE
jgi:hypothetical protein